MPWQGRSWAMKSTLRVKFLISVERSISCMERLMWCIGSKERDNKPRWGFRVIEKRGWELWVFLPKMMEKERKESLLTRDILVWDYWVEFGVGGWDCGWFAKDHGFRSFCCYAYGSKGYCRWGVEHVFGTCLDTSNTTLTSFCPLSTRPGHGTSGSTEEGLQTKHTVTLDMANQPSNSHTVHISPPSKWERHEPTETIFQPWSESSTVFEAITKRQGGTGERMSSGASPERNKELQHLYTMNIHIENFIGHVKITGRTTQRHMDCLSNFQFHDSGFGFGSSSCFFHPSLTSQTDSCTIPKAIARTALRDIKVCSKHDLPLPPLKTTQLFFFFFFSENSSFGRNSILMPPGYLDVMIMGGYSFRTSLMSCISFLMLFGRCFFLCSYTWFLDHALVILLWSRVALALLLVALLLVALLLVALLLAALLLFALLLAAFLEVFRSEMSHASLICLMIRPYCGFVFDRCCLGRCCFCIHAMLFLYSYAFSWLPWLFCFGFMLFWFLAALLLLL